MRCNPWRWLWGLIPLVLVFGIAILAEQEGIEADLKARAEDALANASLGWAAANFSGRDGIVSGRAAEESAQRRAAGVVGDVWGVRTVEDRTDLAELAPSYIWSAALQSNRLRLGGHVPNDLMRKAIIGATKATFPGRELEDQMQPARGSPDQNQWFGGVSFGLQQLARLKGGGRVELDGTSLTIEGEAEDAAAYKSVKAALANSLPQGFRIRTDSVTPPTVKPYVWAASHRAQQLELTGYVPSERQRDEIFEAAKKSFSKTAVVDRMSIAAGEPRGWQDVVGTALVKLGQLEEGSVELRDAQISIAGLAEKEQTAVAIRRALEFDVPSAFKVTEQIKFKEPALAPDTEARRQADADAARAAAAAAAVAEARRKAGIARCREAVGTAVSPSSITFTRASAGLDQRGHSALDTLVKVVSGCPAAVQIEIAGHADAEGTPERKQKLSERRAQTVFDYLSTAGVDARRMTAVGYADTQPVAANDTASSRAKNRRISINVKVE